MCTQVFPYLRNTTMAHHPNCTDYRGMHAGFAPDTGDEFISKYYDRFLHFPIHTYKECLGCCLAYLTVNRNYTKVGTKPGFFYVHFPVGIPPDIYRVPSVSSVARGSEGVMGQIATGYDFNFGQLFRRTFQASRTYQLYVPYGPDDKVARGLSIGFPCNARMESVAIDVVYQAKHCDIADIKLNFADAVLVERYKEMSPKPVVRDSFKGYCMTPIMMPQCMTPVVPVHVALAQGMQTVSLTDLTYHS